MTEPEKDYLRAVEAIQNFEQHVKNVLRMIRELSLLGDHLRAVGDDTGIKILSDAINILNHESDSYKKN